MASGNIPKEQWACIIDKVGGPVEYKKIPTPTPGPQDVLVNIKYSGVCHTDLHAVQGDWPIPTKLPLVGGHEGAGIVVARGDQVTDDECKIGDAVGVKWLNDSCLSCTFCQQADEPLCLTPKLSGYTVDGSFQQYCVASAKHVAKIPKGVPLDEVSPILCAGITVYKGLKESGARPGQTVAIVGAGGGLGSLAQQYAKAMGLKVIAIDSGDEKKKMSEGMGSTFIDFAHSSDITKDVRAATKDGLGPHAVILVAVNEKPFQQAAEYVRGKTPKTPGSAFDFSKSSVGEKKADSASEKEPTDKDNAQRRPPARKSLSAIRPIPTTESAPGSAKDGPTAWPLKHSWIIHYRPPTGKNSDYEKSIQPVCRVGTAQEFWKAYAHLRRPSALPTVSDYHVFKEGIRPVWEDEENKKGGKWTMRLKKGVADRYWEDLLLAMVGDQFAEASEEVCGAVVSVRVNEDVFSIWTKNDGGRNVKIRETIKRVLQLPADTTLVFRSHDESIVQRDTADRARQEKSSQLHGEKRRNTLNTAAKDEA